MDVSVYQVKQHGSAPVLSFPSLRYSRQTLIMHSILHFAYSWCVCHETNIPPPELAFRASLALLGQLLSLCKLKTRAEIHVLLFLGVLVVGTDMRASLLTHGLVVNADVK